MIQGKVKIGMTTTQLKSITGVWPRLRRHRTIETAAGSDEWFYFVDDFTVQTRNGRVVTIQRD